MKSLKGKLLLASSQIIDPNFMRTIVFIVQHGEEGALGLVLNRPLEMSIKEACTEALQIPCALEGVLYQGGPCEGPLMALHADQADGESQVIPGIFFSTDKTELENLLMLDAMRSKFFVGYAGWGTGQLESEMESGSWLVLSAGPDDIFDAAPNWSNMVLRSMLGKPLSAKLIPEDPSFN